MFLIRGSIRFLHPLATFPIKSHARNVLGLRKTPFICRYSTNLKHHVNIEINNRNLSDYILKLQKEYSELTKESNHLSNSRFHELQTVIDLLSQRENLLSSIDGLKELIDSEDKDLSKLAKEEQSEHEATLKQLDEALLEALLPVDSENSHESIVLEIQAGVGGQEAMLFAQELFNMYCAFIDLKGWDYEVADYVTTDQKGLRHASILINGSESYKYFKHEGGVHRVQRVPATEKSGRIHTSTVSVIALPQPSEIDVHIDPKDLKIETKRATGAGGQHVNTTDSAVRIVHLPTNTAVECQVDRSQIKNRKMAMARLRALLYEKEMDSQMAHITATRKSQVRTRNRNEKIRTYNYNQDRITDHRLQGVHYHNLKAFMESGDVLGELIDKLERQSRINRLLEIVEK
ncbi:peptide chain release factor 1-like, mitochondrial [Anthonomus grandis grandis]|uniref:peptide chain release factor 1-like, mitochondrial n=1 Tax=Anthonomus grandis grandis TaxID=2921223 RepID=UPI0021656CE0|nr:peptide chain release factor 1-like, mitochondrial [Anthonomus grandis grandis]